MSRVRFYIEKEEPHELVMCKDCKHRFDGEHTENCCEELMSLNGWAFEIRIDPNGFCHKGERKDGDG